MNRKITLIFITIALLCQCGSKNNSVDEDNLIIEGEGVGKFRIGKTKLDDVVQMLGSDYSEGKHKNTLRTEADYKNKGLSFYYTNRDSSRIIYCVIFTQPFNGKTTKGIGLNSSLKDLLEAYGRPEWSTCDTCNIWTARYRGIEFEIERDTLLPKFPFNEEAHSKKKISKIFVYKTHN
jgi:hypothetical protein